MGSGSSGSSTTSSSRRKRHRPSEDRSSSKKRKHHNHNHDHTPQSPKTKDGHGHGRRASLSAPARDPRDIPQRPRRARGDGAAAAHKAVVPSGGSAARSPSPVIDFDGLSRPSLGTRARLDETREQADERLARMCGAVKTILECVGEDVNRAGLLSTPARCARALLFLTKGYQQNVRDIVNGAIFEEGHNEMVVVKDIEIFSMCEHHLVPFTGKMHIGYIPNQSVIGISKLPRIAEMFARRLQIQERLTKEVANAVMEVLKPHGVAVVMESSHLCMVMRGVEKTSATTITSCVLGCFERQQKTRNEFLTLIGINRS